MNLSWPLQVCSSFLENMYQGGSNQSDLLVMSQNVTWQQTRSRRSRELELKQCSVIAWLTGLSGSGKTTVANAADCMLAASGRHSTVLDGDNLRLGLNRDLGFSIRERSENLRRTAEVARLIAESGLITIVALISPMRADRILARKIAGDVKFLEIFIDSDLAVCEAIDVKGLYAKARSGEIKNFTGVSAPYELPYNPELVISTYNRTIQDSASELMQKIYQVSNL